MSIEAHARVLKETIAEASRGLVQRGAMVELVVLSAIAREHMLVVGPPGTAKSEAVRRVSKALGGRFFEYLLGRFTEPSEIFGPVDLRKLRDGVVETEVTGMLPEADIAFLDEVFRGSTAILNTLLGVLNERVFRRGHTNHLCPLRICVGASNSLPDDPALAAFADRFLVHLFVEPIDDPHLEELLAQGWALADVTSRAPAGRMQALDALASAARQVELGPLRPRLADAVRILRHGGIEVTDRRAVKLQRLVAAAAVLDGRMTATGADLWPIVFAVPEPQAQQQAREQLASLLETSRNEALTDAVEAASLGPLARAKRLVEQGRVSLAQQAPSGDEQAQRSWRLRLEGIAREMDAGFAADQRPAELAEVRAAIVAAIGDG